MTGVIILPIIILISSIISYFWVKGLDNNIKHYNEHPYENPAEGWLDWDDEKTI